MRLFLLFVFLRRGRTIVFATLFFTHTVNAAIMVKSVRMHSTGINDKRKDALYMALLHTKFFSEVLGVACSMDVILPERTRGLIGMSDAEAEGDVPVLYLLHGLSDDHTIWQRRTSIERYAAGKRLAVVMPTTLRGFYTDAKHGYDYFTFISEEVPAKVKSFFHISSKREDTFAAGLSMGGYGAMKLGLLCPDKFAAVASFSGAVDVVRLFENRMSDESRDIFGSLDELRGSDNDLVSAAERLAASGKEKPDIYISCGTRDGLYESNVLFRDKLKSLGYNVVWDEGDAAHEWGFWDSQIQKAIDWMPIK